MNADIDRKFKILAKALCRAKLQVIYGCGKKTVDRLTRSNWKTEYKAAKQLYWRLVR